MKFLVPYTEQVYSSALSSCSSEFRVWNLVINYVYIQWPENMPRRFIIISVTESLELFSGYESKIGRYSYFLLKNPAGPVRFEGLARVFSTF